MRTKKGVITSAKMTGTVTVTVHAHAFHPVYKKRYRKSKKFLCDTNKLDLYPGDEVLITECKPLSKRKKFMVAEILKAAPRVDELKEDEAIAKVIHRDKVGADAEAKAKKEAAAAEKDASSKDAKDADDAKESKEDSSASLDSSDSSESSKES